MAEQDGGCIGVAGHYAGPRSLIPFSLQPDIVRALVRHVAGVLPGLQHINGIDCVAEPAREELISMGYPPANDPDQVSMELEGGRRSARPGPAGERSARASPRQ